MYTEEFKSKLRATLEVINSNDIESLKKATCFYKEIVSLCMDILLSDEKFVIRDATYKNYIKQGIKNKPVEKDIFHKIVCKNLLGSMLNEIHYVLIEDENNYSIDFTEDVETYKSVIISAKRIYNLNMLI